MGQTDIPPTTVGINELKFFAEGYQSKPAWIVSSPLERASKTAEVFSGRLNLPFTTDALWMERFWGIYEGKLKSLRPKEDALSGVETLANFNLRVFDALSKLPTTEEGMIVSHSGVYKALIEIGYTSLNGTESLPHGKPIKLTHSK